MRRVWTVLAASVVAHGALAQVTSLLTIPVADVKGVREMEIGYYVTGTERNIDKGYTHYGYAVLGINERVEIAGNTDFVGGTSWGFKVKVLDNPKGHYALSGGLQNIVGQFSDPFVVGRYDFEKCRVHLGWARDDRSRVIAGVDYALNDSVTLAADHWSGDGGYTWGGFFYSIPGVAGLTASAVVGYPNRRSDGIQHAFGIIYGFRF